ncbi:alcohol dehydrogenase catalytic domain-containing protein [Pseudonocardia sp. ICBG1034]|uniref:alcohol dehydrogenase catalytic domain-containing protein n=1 Tax=Pseudonocardia sp. ICBG1034 TaxID=2844381 RepID=UPI001CCF8EEE|nr:alcohol dehydrogenase catalytic domain-containing protein [Pseudonocardia sp. ICBG1034]
MSVAADLAPWPVAATPGDTMSATVFAEFGPPDVLHRATVATPRPAADEVLVQVAAVSVGRLLDLSARAGTHPYAKFDLPHVLGAEHAGVVAALGAEVSGLEVGQRVAVFPAVSCGACALCLRGVEEACPSLQLIGTHRPGAYADYVAVPARNVHPVPEGVSPVEASALALSGPVARNQLTRAGFEPGQWVLVQGAASALGSTTVALARHLGGRVVATSRSAAKRERLAALGIEAVLDATSPTFVADVRELTDGHGVDLAIDDLGEPAVWAATMDALAVAGTVVTSGAFLGGGVSMNLLRLYSSCQRVVGVRTGNPASVRATWAEVALGFRPVLDRAFPIDQAAAAHCHVESDTNVGRVSLVHTL